VSSSRNGEGHWKLEMMIELTKLTNVEMCVVVAACQRYSSGWMG
jgi:hypothetical protein